MTSATVLVLALTLLPTPFPQMAQVSSPGIAHLIAMMAG